MKIDFSNLKSKSSKLISFSGYDSDYDEVGMSQEDLSSVKSLILESGDLRAFSEILSSHRDLIRTAADKRFMDELKDKYPYLYRNLRYYANKSMRYTNAIESMDKKKLLRKISNINTIRSISDTLLSTMEEPSASFFRGVFNTLAERRIDMMKINQIKDDETGYTLSDEILAKGTPDTKKALDKFDIKYNEDNANASNKPDEGDDWYSPTIKEDSEKVIKKWADKTITSYEEAAELAADSGKAAFGNRYNQEIVDDILKTAKEKFGDDIDSAVAWIKSIYKSVWN